MSSPSPTPEWKKQQELRAARRKPKKSKQKKGPAPVEIVHLAMVIPRFAAPEVKQNAYRALRYSDTIRTYFPAFIEHGPCAKHVAAGTVAFRNIPSPVAQQIQSDLMKGGWKQGTKEQLDIHLDGGKVGR